MSFDDLNLVTVTGQAVTLDGSAARGKVTFAASTLLVDQVTGQAIFPVPLTAVLDVTGAFSVAIPATNDPQIDPVGWVYNVSVAIDGSAVTDVFNLAVPYDTVGSIDLFLAAPVDGSGAIYVPQPTAGIYGKLVGANTWTGTQDFTGATVTGISISGGTP